MFSKIIFFISAVLVIVNFTFCVNSERDSNVDDQLSLNRRSFVKFMDEEKLLSYLSSFGSNPSAEESRGHMIYKRASGRIKKLKKNPSNNSSTTLDSSKKHSLKTTNRNNEKNSVPKNFTSPRHLVKFELEDAKYSEAYEHLRKIRKLRVKRSSGNETNVKKIRVQKLFVQPKEFLKFVYSDAIIAALKPLGDGDKEIQLKSEKKLKREVNDMDSTTSDTRKIKITHPLSTSRTKHVSFEELPTRMQKVVESTISDAILKGKASDGDYLKFYYGDKIIKVPVSLSKYISSLKENYYSFKTQNFQKEEVTAEPPHVAVSNNPFSKYQPIEKYENKLFLSEKAKSYANFGTSKKNSITEIGKESISEFPITKSIYSFSNTDEALSSPVLFESSTKSPVRETIPITEDFNESKFEAPIYPTSYVEYEEKPIDFHENKNYAFGYHVSDFKSGNNFGHTQSKNNKEIKGEYSILLPDGRIQITKYFADDSGFHADVSYQNIH